MIKVTGTFYLSVCTTLTIEYPTQNIQKTILWNKQTIQEKHKTRNEGRTKF